MTRAIWIDEGSNPDKAKLNHYGITAPYFSHRDSRVTAEYLDDVAELGFSPGIYSAWNWYPELSGKLYATKIDNELRRIGWKGNAPVCVDIENHDLQFILDFFRHWRQIRPTRYTAFTFEGFQGGLLAPIIPELRLRVTRFVPQLYDGQMEPLDHSPILDLLMYGVPGAMIDGFYDAARLPYAWRGFAFTQARLPYWK